MSKKHQKKRSRDKWQEFERLVTALHRAQVKGAAVRWNDFIDGRQFDVTVRFRDGLYDHLTVVECKDRGSPVRVEHVDAFATKSRDAKANKAIMVSASGFQRGCLKVAERHGIDLFTLKEAEKLSDATLDGAFTPTIAQNVYGVRLVLSTDGKDVYALPENRNRLPYFLKHGMIEVPGQLQQSLHSYVLKAAKGVRSTFEECEANLSCPHGTLVTLPDSKIGIPTLAVRFKHRLVCGYAVSNGLDAYTSTRLNAMG